MRRINKENDKKKGIPIPIACLLSILIVATAVFIIKGSEMAFGITSGWMTLFLLGLFLAMEIPKGALTKHAVLSCSLGGLYGVVLGECFSIFIPIFLFGISILFVCKFTQKLQIVMNDYALCIATVYTIAGVSNIKNLWMDAIMFALGVVIISVIYLITAKKGKNE